MSINQFSARAHPPLMLSWSLAVFAVVVPYAFIYFASSERYNWLYEEDGIVEWIGAIAWAGCAVLFAIALYRSLHAGRRAHPLWLGLLMVICFVAAGEEISWGQRVLGYSTPEAIKEANLQGEMNLHNLKWLDTRVESDGMKKQGIRKWLTAGRIGTLIWLGFLVALPLGYRFVKPVRRLGDRMHLPVVSYHIAFLALLNYAIFSAFNFLDEGGGPSFDVNAALNEHKETLIAVIFFCSAVLIFTASRSPEKDAEWKMPRRS